MRKCEKLLENMKKYRKSGESMRKYGKVCKTIGIGGEQ